MSTKSSLTTKNHQVYLKFTGIRSKTTELATEVRGINMEKDLKTQKRRYSINFILKSSEKIFYVSFHFTARRSKATGIRTKISGKSKIQQNDDNLSNIMKPLENLNIIRTTVFSLT